MRRAKSVESVGSIMLHVLYAGILLLDADMKLVLPFRSLVAIQSMWVLTQSALLQVTSLPTDIVRGHPSISLPPLSSSTLPLFICMLPTPLYHLQEPHPKADDLRIQSPMTFQKPIHRWSSTSHSPLRSYLWSFGQASDALGQVRATLQHPLPPRGLPFMGGLVL
jgi:hypothetical protein